MGGSEGILPLVIPPKRRSRDSGLQRRSNPAAFTLVEIMIVVVIIGLLAAIAIPAFQRSRQRSQAARLINDFRQFESSFQRYLMASGVTPPGTGVSVVPAGMDGYLPANYTAPSPFGGGYLWSGPSSNIVLKDSTTTDTIMQMVDAALDDGDLATGDFTKISPVMFGLRIH